MVRVLLPFAALLAACTPSPEETAMHSPTPDAGTAAEGSGEAGSGGPASGTANSARRSGGDEQRAAQGPMPEPASAAENPVPGPAADSPAEAEGRRTLSTAFVRLGPDGRLVAELRDGRVLALRNVEMGPREYCGELAAGGSAGTRYCGSYGEVAAARPGSAAADE